MDRNERRRIQNRLAQRRFRQKRQNALVNQTTPNIFPPTFDTQRIPGLAAEHRSGLPDAFTVPNFPEASGRPHSVPDVPPPDVIEPDMTAMENWLSDFIPLSTSSNNNAGFKAFTNNLFKSGPYVRPPATPTSLPSPPEPKPQDGRVSLTPSDPTLQNFVTVGSAGSDSSNVSDQGESDDWVTPLHLAAQRGHERIVEMLLKKSNVDPNLTDSHGRTPLFHAVIPNHVSVARLLVENGARMGKVDGDGRTVLHWAIIYQREEMLRLLLRASLEYERDRFDINSADYMGRTPLHYAIGQGFEDGVLLLLQYGANVTAKVKTNGGTAWNLSSRGTHLGLEL